MYTFGIVTGWEGMDDEKRVEVFCTAIGRVLFTWSHAPITPSICTRNHRGRGTTPWRCPGTLNRDRTPVACARCTFVRTYNRCCIVSFAQLCTETNKKRSMICVPFWTRGTLTGTLVAGWPVASVACWLWPGFVPCCWMPNRGWLFPRWIHRNLFCTDNKKELDWWTRFMFWFDS